MIRRLWTVFRKEVRENLRDRRTMASALLFGPLGAPLLFAVLVGVSLERAQVESDEPLAVSVAGREHAPNLVGFLEQHGVEVEPFEGDLAGAKAVVRDRAARLVLLVPDDFGARLRSGRPAAVQLVSDPSSARSAREQARLGRVLQAYSSQLATQRLQARGLPPTLVQPVVVDAVDVSTPAGRALLVLGMLSYFIVFATLMGGLYVAIDATAGERERGTLEPLLTLPVPRRDIVWGKILAACAFMTLSLALTVAGFSTAVRFVGLESLGMSANFGPGVAVRVFLVMLPFVLLGAALMTLVASFTRSYREAQSWLTAVLLVPTVPIVFAAIYQVQASAKLMPVPSLSQHLLIDSLLRGDGLEPRFVAISAGATLVVGLGLAWVAARLYRREGILG